MNILLDEKLKEMADQCAKGLEEIVLDAVKLRTGNDLTIIELKGRLQKIKYQDSSVEEYYLDDNPLLRIYPIKTEERREGRNRKLVANQPFTLLGERPQDSYAYGVACSFSKKRDQII